MEDQVKISEEDFMITVAEASEEGYRKGYAAATKQMTAMIKEHAAAMHAKLKQLEKRLETNEEHVEHIAIDVYQHLIAQINKYN